MSRRIWPLAAVIAAALGSSARAQPPPPPTSAIGISFLGTADPESLESLAVAEVFPDGPAERAGIRAGDLMLEINGKRLRSYSQLLEIITVDTRPGDKVTVVVRRGVRLKKYTVTLGRSP